MPENPEKPLVLVVDDTPANLALMNDLLSPHYRVKVAASGARALAIAAQQPQPDLVLLDVTMPGLDGHEVCARLKADPLTRDIPVIFLTARSEVRDEQEGLALGAVDYITKPISPPIVLSRVRTHLTLKASADFLKDQNQFLEREVARRTEELRDVQDVTILTLASLAETRDNETGEHIIRTQHFVRLLALELRQRGLHRAQLDDACIDLLFKSAPLHDIGKVGIPDSILLKPGKLTAEEFEIMKTHTSLGKAAIEAAEQRLGKHVPFLQCAKEIAYAHQEKWDGSGYPQGLRGTDIPLSARLMALADVYDALISRRVYKPAFSHDRATDIILQGRGTHFDPDIVDAFSAIQERFRAVVAQYGDKEEGLAPPPANHGT